MLGRCLRGVQYRDDAVDAEFLGLFRSELACLAVGDDMSKGGSGRC